MIKRAISVPNWLVQLWHKLLYTLAAVLSAMHLKVHNTRALIPATDRGRGNCALSCTSVYDCLITRAGIASSLPIRPGKQPGRSGPLRAFET